MRCRVSRWALAAIGAALIAGSTQAAPTLPDRAPAPFTPDPSSQPAPAAPDDSDTWIFSGFLQGSRETFSGTLVTTKADVQFELKLAGGATCEGSNLVPGNGHVRLSEIICSDERVMHALFVPQGGEELKVIGHVGEERFVTSAHILGTQARPEKAQTAEPKAPLEKMPPPKRSPARPSSG